MPIDSIRNWSALILLVILPALALSLAAQQSNSLIIAGQPGSAKVIQSDGRNYVDVESLARLTNGSISFNGNQIVLTLLTCLEGIQLSFGEVLRFAFRRGAFNPNDIHVKSAFLAIHPLAYGIAHMYEHMLHSPRIEVRVFSELEAAAKWLAVKPDRLTL